MDGRQAPFFDFDGCGSIKEKNEPHHHKKSHREKRMRTELVSEIEKRDSIGSATEIVDGRLQLLGFLALFVDALCLCGLRVYAVVCISFHWVLVVLYGVQNSARSCHFGTQLCSLDRVA